MRRSAAGRAKGRGEPEVLVALREERRGAVGTWRTRRPSTERRTTEDANIGTERRARRRRADCRAAGGDGEKCSKKRRLHRSKQLLYA
jgi:hypothetical protein